MLTSTLATTLARTALANVVTEFPYKLDQLLTRTEDLATPRALHPVFWGSYDWHSCVHMHWTLARLLRRFPDHELAGATRAQLLAGGAFLLAGAVLFLAGTRAAEPARPS